MTTECRHTQDAHAFITGELSPSELAEFERHLSDCAACGLAVEATRGLISRLRAVPEAEPRPDLAALIMARIRDPEELPVPVPAPAHRRASRWLRIAAIAAVATLLAGGGAVKFFQGARNPVPTGAVATAVNNANHATVARALNWFVHNQEANGSWDAEKWGGNRRFSVALTALPVVALLDGEPTAERIESARRASAYLLEQQRPNGTFGDAFREAPYIQSVSTLALLRMYEQQPSPELKRALDVAMQVVLSTQSPEGAWGYYSSAPSVAITLWHRDVVELAANLGWTDAQASLAKSNAWLAAQPADTSALVVAEPGTDFHRAYFTAASLRQNHDAQAQQRLVAIRQALVATQSEDGNAVGTWQPTDQWSRVGGRLYTTALATLALR